MNKTIEVQALEQSEAKYKTNLTGEVYYKGFFAGMRRAIDVVEAVQKPLTVSSGKERELKYLTQISEACGEGSYLHTLLSKELVTWASKMIANGVPPDVMTNWVETQKEVTRLERLVQENKDRYIAALDECSKTQKSTIRVYQNHLCKKDEDLAVMDKLLTRAKNDIAALQRLQITSNNQSTEILLLKAEIYDLTHRRED